MIIFGEPGAGKSLLTKYIENKIWKESPFKQEACYHLGSKIIKLFMKESD